MESQDSEAAMELEELVGKPVEIELGTERIVVGKAMPIRQQIRAVDLYSKSAGDSEKMFDCMMAVVGMACGREAKDVEAVSSLMQVVEAFTVVWKQNGFIFLLKKVRELNKAIEVRG